MHRWPLRQWFHCVQSPETGGETPIVDCRRMHDSLDPNLAATFAQKGLLYVRNFIEGLDVSWQEFFGTSNKSDVEAYCRRNHVEFEWTGNNLRTRQISPGVAAALNETFVLARATPSTYTVRSPVG